MGWGPVDEQSFLGSQFFLQFIEELTPVIRSAVFIENDRTGEFLNQLSEALQRKTRR
jgi:hypothetical protein